MLKEYLEMLRDMQGSDLHLAAGSKPKIRRFGRLVPVDLPELQAEEVRRMAGGVVDLEELDKTKNLDFSYREPELELRYRCNAFVQKSGVNLVMRAIPNSIPSFEQLGLPEHLKKFTRFRTGMVLVTGPASSGKTATLAAMVNVINHERAEHIICIEDPVEFVHKPARALVNQRQLGRDVISFPAALRAALREDPDVIVVGELRDLETIGLAITAAETGHLVLGTLHTNSAINTIARLVDAFPPDSQNQVRQMLAESLRGVISQQLIPRSDGQGRVLALEVFTTTQAISALIRSGENHKIPMAMQAGGKSAEMQTMDDSLLSLVKAQAITTDDALLRCHEIETFPQRLGLQEV